MKQRLITGTFIVLATVLAIVAKFLPYTIGDYVFDIFALTISIVSGFEMANIMQNMGKKVHKYLTTMFCVFNYIVLMICLELISFNYIVLIQIAALILYFFIVVICSALQNKGLSFKDNSKIAFNTILACIYPSFMFCLIVSINHIDSYVGIKNFSMLFIIAIFAITYFTDTFAYIVGRTVKGPKLAPKISPNKTISGSIGGLLGGVAAAMLLFLLASKTSWVVMLETYSLKWWHFLILGAVASAVGQCGDLFESALKRKAGIKDSGSLFPGHGGMLDRYDAMTFVSALVYVFLVIVLIV